MTLGDWGFELGGEMITFLLMSMSTAAVSRCCCSCVRLRIWTIGLIGGWLVVDVVTFDCWWLGDECTGRMGFMLSIGITDTEFASRWFIWDLLSNEVTRVEAVFVAAAGLDVMVTVWMGGCADGVG